MNTTIIGLLVSAFTNCFLATIFGGFLFFFVSQLIYSLLLSLGKSELLLSIQNSGDSFLGLTILLLWILLLTEDIVGSKGPRFLVKKLFLSSTFLKREDDKPSQVENEEKP